MQVIQRIQDYSGYRITVDTGDTGNTVETGDTGVLTFNINSVVNGT